jgi:RimJ/RimL family protein N-acetyltransferase
MDTRLAAVTTIRPIEPDDKAAVRAFYHELSDRSRRLRFLVPTSEISDEDLAYLTEVDHRRHEALVALDGDRVVGVARFVRTPGDRESAEVAVVVVDDRQNQGIGTALLDQLTERARENGIVRYTALVSRDNEIVLGALERAGAARTGSTDDGEIEFAVDLPAEGLGERLRASLRGVALAVRRLRP